MQARHGAKQKLLPYLILRILLVPLLGLRLDHRHTRFGRHCMTSNIFDPSDYRDYSYVSANLPSFVMPDRLKHFDSSSLACFAQMMRSQPSGRENLVSTESACISLVPRRIRMCQSHKNPTCCCAYSIDDYFGRYSISYDPTVRTRFD